MTDPAKSPRRGATGDSSPSNFHDAENPLSSSPVSTSTLNSEHSQNLSDSSSSMEQLRRRPQAHSRSIKAAKSRPPQVASDDIGSEPLPGSSSRFGTPRVKNLPSSSKEIAVWWMWILVYLRAYRPPVLDWAPKYQLKWFANDIAAGICTGILLLPQGMAYAALAGLPPVYGYYAALAPSIVYILLGPSPVVVIGPASVISLLIGNAIKNSTNPVLAATTLSFFVGVIFLGLGFLRLGFLATLISKPIIVGFTAASALIVDSTQIKYVFGLTMKSNSNIIEFFQYLVPAVKNGGNGWAALMALTALAFLILLRFIPKGRFIPGPVIVVILCIILTWSLKLNVRAKLAIVGDIPSGLPEPKLPLVASSELSKLAGSMVVVAAIALVELISIAKVFAVKAGTIVNINMELVAVGAAALVGSFFQAFPSSASFTRTTLNASTGAKSQLSNVTAMVILVIVLSFAAKALYYLPFACLGAIVIASTISLFDYKEAYRFWKCKKLDFVIMVLTFVLTLLIGPDYGVLASVGLNIFIILWNQSRLVTHELAQLPKAVTASLFDVQHPEINEKDEIKLLNTQGPSDALFVIKDYFPEAFVHPHLFVIRPMDSLTYVNIDNWFMSTVSEAYSHLVEGYELESSPEMVEARQSQSSSSSLSSSSSSKDEARNVERVDGDMELSVTFASDVESNGSGIGKIGNRGKNSRGGEGDSSEEDDLSFSFSSTGRGGSRPTGRGRRSSIGSIRFADDDEISRREEEENEHKVDAESKRTEIVSYAEKTHNLIGFVIIDMIHMNHIDSVVVGRLSDLFLTLQKNNISLAIARPRPQVLRYLITGKFVKLIGQDFVVDSVHTAVIRCNAVLRAARQFQVQKLISAESSSTQSAQTTSSEPGSQSASPNPSYTLIKPVTKGNDDKHEVAINMPVAQGKAAVDEHHIEDGSAGSTTSSTDEDSPV